MTARFERSLVAASLIMTTPAGAQFIDATADTGERVVVTASRAPIDVRRIGSATTIITRDEIERRQARYLSDVLRSVPGFAFSLSGGVGSQTQARARGGEANHVLVLIDGVRANDPATGDEFRWEHLTMGNVERIEVVRGPQSAVWGSDAISAVVNVITRTVTDASNIDGYVETGSHETLNVGLNAFGSRDHWTLSGSAESLDTAGTNISRTGDETDGADLVTAAITTRYQGPNQAAFNASLRAAEGISQYDDIDFIATGLPFDSDLRTKSNNLIANLGAAFASHRDRVAWHLRGQYFDSNHLDFVDGIENTLSASQRVMYGLQADIGLVHNNLSLALEHETTDFEQRGPIGYGNPNQDQQLQVASAIAEYQYLAADRITWVLGGRYDDNSVFDDALTGRVSMAYELSGAARLRASLGTGQKAPTFIERFGYFPEDFIGNPALKPETSISYDIGIDRYWLNQTLFFSASVYRQELDNEIDGFVPVPGTFFYTAENAPGKSNRQGVELAARWQINAAMRLAASVTYTDATEVDDAGSDERELRRPRQAGSLSFSYQPPGRKLELDLHADYGGNRDDVFYAPYPEPSRRLRLADYWLVDISAQYRLTPTLRLFARGANLLDEDYQQLYGYVTPGRTGYVGFRADFGRR